MKVKICGLTNQADAEWALECGADALGFNYEPSSPRFVGAFEHAAGLPQRMPSLAFTVAVYGPYRPPVPAGGFSAVQSVGSGPEDWGGRHLKVVRVRPDWNVEDVLHEIGGHHWVLLDTFNGAEFGGSGLPLDWHLAAEVVAVSSASILLAGGLTPDNVGDAIRLVKPYGVDVCSGVERAKGVKDPVKVRDFIAASKIM